MIFRGNLEISKKLCSSFFNPNFAEIWFVVQSCSSNKEYISENFFFI